LTPDGAIRAGGSGVKGKGKRMEMESVLEEEQRARLEYRYLKKQEELFRTVCLSVSAVNKACVEVHVRNGGDVDTLLIRALRDHEALPPF
jgi:hypothetical protein